MPFNVSYYLNTFFTVPSEYFTMLMPAPRVWRKVPSAEYIATGTFTEFCSIPLTAVAAEVTITSSRNKRLPGVNFIFILSEPVMVAVNVCHAAVVILNEEGEIVASPSIETDRRVSSEPQGAARNVSVAVPSISIAGVVASPFFLLEPKRAQPAAP